MNQGVFISYAAKDTEKVSQLYDCLNTFGVSIWIASKNIAPGEEWNAEIQKALDVASHILVVVSRASLESSYVLSEVEYALSSKKVVIPILIEDVKLPPRWYILQFVDWRDLNKLTIEKLSLMLPKQPLVTLRALFQDKREIQEIRDLLFHPHWLLDLYAHYGLLTCGQNTEGQIDGVGVQFVSIGNSLTLYYLCSPYESPFVDGERLSAEVYKKVEDAKEHLQAILQYLPKDHVFPSKMTGFVSKLHFRSENHNKADMFDSDYQYATILDITAKIIAGQTHHYTTDMQWWRHVPDPLITHNTPGRFEFISYTHLLKEISGTDPITQTI